MKQSIVLAVTLILSINVVAQDRANIQIDFANETGDMKPVWASFGYDEPNWIIKDEYATPKTRHRLY